MRVYATPLAFACVLGAFAGCSSPSAPSGPSPAQSGLVSFQYDFNQGPQGWTSGFANYYNEEDPAAYKLTAFPGLLPSPLLGSGLEVSGQNASSTGLFLYYKRQISGLRPGGAYVAVFTQQIATATPFRCVGAGGPPDNVYVKTGATAREPTAIATPTSVPGLTAAAFNLDIGYQQTDGADAVTMGNVVNSLPCGDPNNGWQLKALPSHIQHVTAGPDGTTWLFTGIQFGGTEVRLGIYFTTFNVIFTPAS